MGDNPTVSLGQEMGLTVATWRRSCGNLTRSSIFTAYRPGCAKELIQVCQCTTIYIISLIESHIPFAEEILATANGRKPKSVLTTRSVTRNIPKEKKENPTCKVGFIICNKKESKIFESENPTTTKTK